MKSKSIFSTKTRDAPLSFRLSFAFTVCHALDTVIHVIGPHHLHVMVMMKLYE